MDERIVVVGGGYGGMAFTKRFLSHHVDGASLTLIDRNPYHTMLTEVHQVAAGRRAPDSVILPFTAIDGCTFMQATVQGLDLAHKSVITSNGTLPYDRLIVAPGSIDTDYGIPGVREHTVMLHGVADALTIRDRLTALPAGAPILIAGGGLTGVEMAAELGHSHGQRNLTLIEAAPTLLPGLSSELQRRSRKRLGSLGVNVLTATRIAQVAPKMVHFTDGSCLPFHLMIWACGVRANPLLVALGIPTDQQGRALVNAQLETSLPQVYVIGDAAAGLPPTAQVAVQQGAHLADHVAGLLRGYSKPLRPTRELGTLVELGHGFAVGQVGRQPLTGWIPAIMKHANNVRWAYTSGGLRRALNYLLGPSRNTRR
jgi:NADH dehydrogenase